MKKTKKTKVGALSVVLVTSLSIFISSSLVSAAPTSFGHWASRTQSLSVNSGSDLSAWSSGASKWRNASNFQVTAKLGLDTIYYAADIYDRNKGWDGNCNYTTVGGIITKASININTYFTGQSKYTESVKATLAGHEIGHSLGLNHVSDVDISSIMNPYTFLEGGSLARPVSPSSSDISVVNSIYPPFLTNDTPNQGTFSIPEGEEVIHMHPSWPVYYANEEELREAADLVIRGTVSGPGVSTFQQGDETSYATLSQINVLDIVKGDLAQVYNSITITQMGGTFGNLKVYAEGSTLLTEDQEVVLFLQENTDGTYRSINGDDGIYVNTGGKFQNIATTKTFNYSNLINQ